MGRLRDGSLNLSERIRECVHGVNHRIVFRGKPVVAETMIPLPKRHRQIQLLKGTRRDRAVA